MRGSAFLVCGVLLLFLVSRPLLYCQTTLASPEPNDSDGDGLSDKLEQSLLREFAPNFMVAGQDCSDSPAEFVHDLNVPKVQAENGTIYGQVFPAKTVISAGQTLELHFYHLWKQDCGSHGHPLDAEHVSVLVRTGGITGSAARWRAVYWYAAAHENTVCDVSQITRAATLKAEDHGATVWISPGKHASFLNQKLCHRGCGSDRCEQMQSLAIKRIVNLGELGRPMNGAVWTSSPSWPLAEKMTRSDFPTIPLARLETLPLTDIAWFNPGRHPTQGMIAISNSTADALATSGDSTFTAISVAGDSTGNAFTKGYRKTVHAIGTSARHVGNGLHPQPKTE